jgi:hypothetical protein
MDIARQKTFNLVLIPGLLPAILKNGGHLEFFCIPIKLTEQQYTSLFHTNMILAIDLKTFCYRR